MEEEETRIRVGPETVGDCGRSQKPGTGRQFIPVIEHIDIKFDLSELDITSAETKATYQEIKDYVLDKHGLKVSTLYISQVKAKCGIIERECYNKGEGKSRVPQCPKEKEEAIMDASRNFRMI